MACVNMGLKDYKAVLEIPELVQAKGEPLTMYASDPFSDEIKDRPRFKALLEREEKNGARD